jgi:hypothetical protein
MRHHRGSVPACLMCFVIVVCVVSMHLSCVVRPLTRNRARMALRITQNARLVLPLVKLLCAFETCPDVLVLAITHYLDEAALVYCLQCPRASELLQQEANTSPKCFQGHTTFAFLGFVVAVMFIYATSEEIVNVILSFGVVFDVGRTVLGITVSHTLFSHTLFWHYAE